MSTKALQETKFDLLRAAEEKLTQMQTLNKETTSEGGKKPLLQRSIYYEQVQIYKNTKLTQGLERLLPVF